MKAPKVLRALGWNLVGATESRILRQGMRGVLLAGRLIEVLRTRRFDYKGASYALSPNAIDQVLRELSTPGFGDGLLAANERLHARLAYGITVTEFMPDGRRHQPTIAIVDWSRPEANRFDAVERFSVLSTDGRRERIVGMVGFVNGVPLAVFESDDESNRDDDAIPGDDPDRVHRAIERHLRHQQPEEIPQLYVYAQLLVALGDASARYGTTRTPLRFWARWKRDEEFDDARIRAITKKPADDRTRLLVGLLTPSRLLEIVRCFVLFDQRGGKLVARPHQFFGVRVLLHRLAQRQPDGRREGGVVWHTTGSGKSYTMVFLSKALLLDEALKACRIVVITDRQDLEQQLGRNFAASGAFGSSLAARRESERSKAATGRELAQRIGRGSERITFALVQKFNTASRSLECRNRSADIVVLVDESHRSHGGTLHAQMKRVLPRAAYIAFTGTPLLKEEKRADVFGPIVHAYTMQQAIEDQTVAPLLYEERLPAIEIDAIAIDHWFDRVSAGMNASQRDALAARIDVDAILHGASARIDLIAWDIATHFDTHYKATGSGLKGQLATASKLDAIRYQRALDRTGRVSSRVVISAPDAPEGHATKFDAFDDELIDWWQHHASADGGDAQAYERHALRDFASAGAPDLLIVVDRLLTGFDEPRNAVLYIDKPLKGHGLMQAVARVNRLHPAKRHGLLVDYRGILQALDNTLRDYQDLAERTQGGFDIGDLDGLYRRVDTVWHALPALHAALWRPFEAAGAAHDVESLRQALRPRFGIDSHGRERDLRQALRASFSDALDAFEEALQIALGSRDFRSDLAFPASVIDGYASDLQLMRVVRDSVLRDAGHAVDVVDAKKLPPSAASMRDEAASIAANLQPNVDAHISALEVREPQARYAVAQASDVAATDESAGWSDARARSEAALVRTRLRRTIDVELSGDPYAQTRFSELLSNAIARTEALFDRPAAQYAMLRALEQDVATRKVPGMPDALRDKPAARAWFGILLMATGKEEDDRDVRVGSAHGLDRTALDPAAQALFVDDAIAIDRVVKAAAAEHSLSVQDMESAIRKGLLLRFYGRLGIERTNAIIEKVLALGRGPTGFPTDGA